LLRSPDICSRVSPTSVSAGFNLLRSCWPARSERRFASSSRAAVLRPVLRIEFSHKDIPTSIPSETALTLYRIVQEGPSQYRQA
jgi:hypothetical protein